VNRLKKIISVIIVAVLVFCLPVAVSATETGEYTISLSGSIDGKNFVDTSFRFKVVCSLLEESDEERIIVFEETVTYNTSERSQYDFKVRPEHVENGGYVYEFKMVGSSNLAAAGDTKTVTVYFLKDEFGESIVKAFDSSKADSDMPEEEILEFPYNISFDCKTGSVVSIEMVDPEITKVYDGTDALTLSPEDYRLTGVSPEHEVYLEIGLAKFNAVDVKNATSVVLSDFTLKGADADKYVVKTQVVEHPARITPRPITVTVDNITMTKGAAIPEFTYKLSEELILGNEVSGSLFCRVGDAVGNYTISRGTLAINDNYDITFREGKLTVTNFSFSSVIDKATSIKVSGYLSQNAKLEVSNLSQSDNAYKVLKSSVSTGSIIKGYNISVDGGYDGQLEVVIPVASKYEGKGITVYQRLNSGGIARYSATAKNGEVTVSVSDGTAFLLVTDEESEESGLSIGRLLLIILVVLLCAILLIVLIAGAIFIGLVYFNKTDELQKIMKTFKKVFKKK